MDPNIHWPYFFKAQQWERAKGELRALVALQGATMRGSTSKWPDAREAVEDFIKEFEAEGLNE